MEDLVNSTFLTTLNYIRKNCVTASQYNIRTFISRAEDKVVTGHVEMTTLTNILSALFDKELKRDAHDKTAVPNSVKEADTSKLPTLCNAVYYLSIVFS